MKILVTATPQERARRRALELQAAGARVSEAEILADILRRDERDMTRSVAPLKAAPDAHLLDTTYLDIDATFRAAVEIVDFPDGEIGVKLNQNIRGCDVFIVQPTGPPVNSNIVELLILIDACRRDKAAVGVLGFVAGDPSPYGRLIVQDGMLEKIVESRSAILYA